MTRQKFQAMIFTVYPYLELAQSPLPECVSIACKNEFIEPKMSEQEREQLRKYAKQLETQGWFTFDEKE